MRLLSNPNVFEVTLISLLIIDDLVVDSSKHYTNLNIPVQAIFLKRYVCFLLVFFSFIPLRALAAAV